MKQHFTLPDLRRAKQTEVLLVHEFSQCYIPISILYYDYYVLYRINILLSGSKFSSAGYTPAGAGL